MKVVIIGGTGLIGTKVGKILKAAGHEVIPASPSTGVNTLTGAGLAEALQGTQVVVDVSNSPSFADEPVMQFFQTSTANIVQAALAARVEHLAILSVVGADRFRDSGYMRAKLVQEKLVAESGIPYTIVRATQFFEFLGAVIESGADGETIRLTPAAMQPIASDDVAAEMARVASAAPLNAMTEVGGPQRIPLSELGQRLLAAKGDSRKVIADPQARYFGELLDDGTLVTGADARLAPTRFEDWLPRDQTAAR